MEIQLKSAKEMFEELGYELREETNCLNCVKSYINYKTLNIIYFDSDKTIDVNNMIITYDLLQAINKQVEELWGDDLLKNNGNK